MRSCLPLLGACCLAACSAAAAHAAPPEAKTPLEKNLEKALEEMREKVPPASTKNLEVTAEYAPRQEEGKMEYYLDVTFKNTGKKPIRLLDRFTPELMNNLFFSVFIWNEQGKKVVSSIAGAKVSFSYDVPYKEIEPEGIYTVAVPLKWRFRKDPGKYKLELVYHSRYGKNCVLGNFKAPPVFYTIE
mgnify:CR=1 FL=1|jgi:hypothetical protein